MKKTCAVVLGGYVNGYSIVQELSEFDIPNMALLYYRGQMARLSNRLSHKACIDRTSGSLLSALIELNKKYDYLVLFPTDDVQIENLSKIEEKILEFCFLPFNTASIREVSSKATQYDYCKKLNIPYPKTVPLSNTDELGSISEIGFPLLIKPKRREDLRIKVFRSMEIKSKDEWEKAQNEINQFLKRGVEFVVSEIIPGDTNGTIYAYTGYRSPARKKIVNEWIGKKLTQFPDDYGVFSSASNEAPEIVREQGRALLNGMNLYGICEPEFKYDPRDGKYKLMEINLRSMMWHRTGNLSGVYLQNTQWLDAIGETPPKYIQSKRLVHFSYLKHELTNLFFRKSYFRHWKHNLFHGEKNELALFDKGDIKPFLADQLATLWLIFKFFIKKILN